jgi:His/Glu/Gln/Arg/opine family amino acid ABC transporter permease subunit
MPDWAEPVARYVLEEGLPNTLRVAAIAVVASTVIGVLLGTLFTIRTRALRALIRLYVEIFRGLPILVTVFATFFLLPTISGRLEFSPLNAGTIALRSGGARRWRRRRAALCSRSPASSATPRRRSASSGSTATPT